MVYGAGAVSDDTPLSTERCERRIEVLATHTHSIEVLAQLLVKGPDQLAWPTLDLVNISKTKSGLAIPVTGGKWASGSHKLILRHAGGLSLPKRLIWLLVGGAAPTGAHLVIRNCTCMYVDHHLYSAYPCCHSPLDMKKPLSPLAAIRNCPMQSTLVCYAPLQSKHDCIPGLWVLAAFIHTDVLC
jgi:hypothetical protein